MDVRPDHRINFSTHKPVLYERTSRDLQGPRQPPARGVWQLVKD
jgi:hypothetical protein